MTSQDSTDNYNAIPNVIDNYIDMLTPNSSINIYQGNFTVGDDLEEVHINGSLEYRWFPTPGIYFSGNVIKEREGMFDIVNRFSDIKIIIDGLEFGKGYFKKRIAADEFNVTGVVSSQAVIGDRSIKVTKLRFSIPNFREFIGQPVAKISGSINRISNNRLHFENDDIKLNIDKCLDYYQKFSSLEQNGGYMILYNGELESKKNAITITDIQDFLNCFNAFLSFLNGRRTSIHFIQGLHDGEVIWTDYSSYPVDIYKYVQSWPQLFWVKPELNEIWIDFYYVWKRHNDFLSTVIHWYIEANGQSGFVEGSIIMAQTALELLYNWWIVETKKMIIGKEAEGISAANKIRLLLSQLALSHDEPSALTHLQQFVLENTAISDIPEAIVQIRNAIVHSQEEKRKKLDAIPLMAKYEALQVFLWYIELCLLRILKYEDKYWNRCSGKIVHSEATMFVPWVKV